MGNTSSQVGRQSDGESTYDRIEKSAKKKSRKRDSAAERVIARKSSHQAAEEERDYTVASQLHNQSAPTVQTPSATPQSLSHVAIPSTQYATQTNADNTPSRSAARRASSASKSQLERVESSLPSPQVSKTASGKKKTKKRKKDYAGEHSITPTKEHHRAADEANSVHEVAQATEEAPLSRTVEPPATPKPQTSSRKRKTLAQHATQPESVERPPGKLPKKRKREASNATTAEIGSDPTEETFELSKKRRKRRSGDDISHDTGEGTGRRKSARKSQVGQPTDESALEAEKLEAASSQVKDDLESKEHGDASKTRSRVPPPPGMPTSGAFEKPEVARIAQAVEAYCFNHSLSQNEFNDMVQSGTVKDFEEMWGEICAAVPYRTRQSVHRFCKRRYHNAKRGKWDPDEDDTLRKAYELKPDRWKEIGAMVGRLPDDCRDRWRDYVMVSGVKNRDYWTEEEKNTLIRTVEDCLLAMEKAKEEQAQDNPQTAVTPKKGKADDPEANLNWIVVSQKMGGTRSRIQCMAKWRQLIKRRDNPPVSSIHKTPEVDAGQGSWRVKCGLSNYNKMLPGDKLAILQEIAKSEAVSEDNVPWHLIRLQNPDSRWSVMDKKVAWMEMKKLVKPREGLQELLEAIEKRLRKIYPDQLDQFYRGDTHKGRYKTKQRRKSKEVVSEDESAEEEEEDGEPDGELDESGEA
ncbi:hypothetical protein H2199_000765 [Coniosporium tulheliwenetii]|uniref:Uncharacterized protein n=1 Tax=Coniosporium tulheliwenetii TaxID=3383036 RepID=A0ACC2ZMW9_9PEZI|nr:hypothetical protein H2199_000765 [Cladosporium sp. JES 115]